MISNKEIQTIIISYLSKKLGVGGDWMNAKQSFLFNQSPIQVIENDGGEHLIKWLEDRLGLK